MNNSTSTDLAAAAAAGRPDLDAASHRIWRNKEIIAPVLQEVVPEFAGASIEEICSYIMAGPAGARQSGSGRLRNSIQ